MDSMTLMMCLINLVIFIAAAILPVFSLTPEENLRVEQKFRYYKEFVRPVDNRNYNFSANDYIFTLRTYVDLGSTVPRNSELKLDLIMSIKIYDRELSFNGLDKRFILPSTFKIWLPNLTFVPNMQPNITREIEPKSGEIMVRYSFKNLLPCTYDSWRHPFEMFYCDLTVISREDEKLVIEENNDKRWDFQKRKVQYSLDYDPHLTLRFRFPHKWYSALVTSILPSLLVFCVAVFAQWKTQKVQVFISAMAVISIVIMQTAHRGANTLSLEDLWLCCTFLHVVCVLVVDLAIPARRVRYDTIDEDSYDGNISGGKRVFAKGKLSVSEGAQIVIADRPMQTKVSAFPIGKRKKVALSAIVLCYFIFVISYFITVTAILCSYG